VSRPITRDEYLEREAAAMTEAVLQSRVLGMARELGYIAYHTHDSRRSQPGYPDLHLVSLRRGRSLMRELKTTRGRVSPDQQTWLVALRAAGVDAAVWRPMDLLDGTVLETLTAPPKEL
jgi:hypothetical protein